jgi:hypothetical protein
MNEYAITPRIRRRMKPKMYRPVKSDAISKR